MTISLASTKAGSLVRRIKALDESIAAQTAERKALANSLVLFTPNMTGSFSTDGGQYVIAENNTYDQEVIRSILSPGQVRRCSVLKMDNPTVKRLYPAAYASAKVTNGYKVTVK